MKTNPYFEELQKIAGMSSTLTPAEDLDPINPDTAPKATPEKVAAEQGKSSEELDEEARKKKDDAEEKKEEESENKQAAEIAALEEKIAAVLPEFGALAKIIELTAGEEGDMQKRASIALQDVLSGDEGYTRTLTKVAQDFFCQEENLAQLHSEAGHAFVMEQLAFFVEDEDMQKVASEEEGSFVKKVMDAGQDLVYNMTHLSKLKEELAQANELMQTLDAEKAQVVMSEGTVAPRALELTNQFRDAGQLAGEKEKALLQGKVGWGGLGALAAGGAIYGGKKIYDATHQDDGMVRAAAEEDKLLLSKDAGGKLDTDNAQEENGGMDPMNKRLVPDFLKIAGAAALITVTNDETVDAQFRKQASDQFDEIARMGRKDMNEALIKVAKEVYTEDQLHEIVAGKHTAHLLDKVAFFISANDMSVDELTKVAGAEGVAAKGVAGALSDAASNITATIDQAKKDAEGAGREYIGEVAGTNPGKGENAGTGKVGGGLVGGTEGYSVINNPGEFGVEQTAATMIEEAVLAKHAAQELIKRSDAFLAHFVKPLSK